MHLYAKRYLPITELAWGNKMMRCFAWIKSSSKCYRAIFFTIIVTAMCASVARAETTELQGIFRAPPIGTKFQFSDVDITVKSIEKFSIKYLNYSPEDGRKDREYFSLFSRLEPGSRTINLEEKHAKFWPLKVGNKVSFEARVASHSYPIDVDLEVLGTENILIPAGEYFVYRISRNVTISNLYAAEGIIWYSPRLALPIKFVSKITRGRDYGLTQESILQNVSYTSKEVGIRHENGAIRSGAPDKKAVSEEANESTSAPTTSVTIDSPVNSSSIRSKLILLKKMFSEGLLTEDEYKSKKKKLLDNF